MRAISMQDNLGTEAEGSRMKHNEADAELDSSLGSSAEQTPRMNVLPGIAEQENSLRVHAEQVLQKEDSRSLEASPDNSFTEMKNLLHELRVHQIELEMQNEELKRAREEIEDSRSRYFDLYEMAPTGYFTLNDNGVILEANLTAAGLLGTVRSDLIGRPFSRFIPREDQDLYYSLRRKLLESSEPQNCELQVMKKDGSVLWVCLAALLRQNAENLPVCRIMATDITLRRLSEEALQESETRHKAMIANISDVIGIIGCDGIIRYKSSNVEKYFGWRPEELVGADYRVIVHPDDQELVQTAFLSILTTPGTEKMIEFRYRCKDGICRAIRLSAMNLLHDPAIGGMLVNYHDISAQKRAEAELRDAKEAAEAANDAQRQFLANMSHEIRTPMNGYMGMLQLMEQTQLTDEQKEYVRISKVSTNALLVIINDILDFAKLKAGKMGLEKRLFSLKPLVDDVVSLFRISAAKTGVSIEVCLAEDIPATLSGDPFRLRQVLSNLIGNAVKFTNAGWIRVSAGLSDAVGDQKIKLSFLVEDTGIGIPEDRWHTLFRMFSQADDSDTRKYGGTGLGLAISKGLVEMMNGEIWLQKKEGAGSCFRFTVVLDEDSSAGGMEKQSVSNCGAQKITVKRNLLLAEDDEMSIKLMQYYARRVGWNLTLAENGKVAADLLLQNRYDAILMDVQMPGVDGLTATRMIRKVEEPMNRHTPIIAMTAYAMRSDRERCLNAGMDDYLPKPLNMEDLFAAVEKWCSRRQA